MVALLRYLCVFVIWLGLQHCRSRDNDADLVSPQPNLTTLDTMTIAQARALHSGQLPGGIYITDTDKTGIFYLNEADRTSADNLGTILVTANGKRYKRSYSGAASAAWFGVTSTSDDNAPALQTAINSVPDLLVGPGEYLIASTINIPSHRRITFAKNAIIQAGVVWEGMLHDGGLHFLISGQTDITIDGLRIDKPLTAFHSGEIWNASLIEIINSTQIRIQNSEFISTHPMEAIVVRGAKSKSVVLENNYCEGAGITYSENGASNVTVRNCRIINTVNNGLSGIGNASGSPATGCIVENNVLENIGRMGIEDWRNISGTIIRNNKVSTTGVTLAFKTIGFGISAVGTKTLITGNTVNDPKDTGIEINGYAGSICEQNVVNFASFSLRNGKGIVANFADDKPIFNTREASLITRNTVTNGLYGIWSFGSAFLGVNITQNQIINPVLKGIDVDCLNATSGTVQVANNSVQISVPSVRSQYGPRVGYYIHGSRSGVKVEVSQNKINYTPTASNGDVYEIGFTAALDNVLIQKNSVWASGVQANGAPVFGFASNGATNKGLRFIDNTVDEAVVSLETYSNPYLQPEVSKWQTSR
ncbi:right-handed parallel beta-helix repeat-containing protein [Fibrisoma limi]|nr:right-handed parallel beta-helix repeat-containing protein [Fibrisoma limi]